MRTTLEIKRIDLWSLFKIAFFLYATAGLVAGLFYGLFLLAANALQNVFVGDELPRFGIIGGVFGVVLIPFLAVFYGVIGSAFVTIVGFLYNVLAGSVGGLRVSARVDVGQAPARADDTPPTI